jgi:LmbE family N-acetylglucosaminyl deacetylase
MAYQSKTVLIVASHPDDETLGMGGTIKKHVTNDEAVTVVTMTDGVSARGVQNNEVAMRTRATESASEILGFAWESLPRFKDNAMDTYPLLEIIKHIEHIKLKINPDIVYTHCAADLNIDHQITARAVLTAFRPHPNEKCTEIRCFEVPSATDYGHESITGSFSPNLFVDIQKEWPDKERALMAYKNELRSYPHSRSFEAVKNLAKVRGNQIGLHMAEAFQVLRKIEM